MFLLPHPVIPSFYFSLSKADGLTPAVAQFNIYMFPSVWFPLQRGGGLSCVGFATAALEPQLF